MPLQKTYISRTRMYIVSSNDFGKTWSLEKMIGYGKDLREPYLLEVNGILFFYFFEAGTNPIAFEPRHLQTTWEAENWGGAGRGVWQFKILYAGSLTLARN